MTLLAARTHDDELKGMLDNALNRKGKRKASPEEEKEEQEDSKRVSTAEAFSNLRLTMGPPATPPRRGLRSASSTIPSSASLPTLELYARPHSALATVRPAEGDDEGLPSDDEEVDVGDLIYDKNYHGGSKKHKGSLTVLSHVRAFVDVRDAHTSRDSGEAFVEFLEELGAKVFKKLTKTCTHIVFKNGSFSTVSKWKAAETKPLVVRISWVTECVNRKEHVAEDEHLIDISGLFPSGVDPKNKVHKRRSSRSGHVSSDGADESCDISMDSSSQPLEVARHRRRDSRESGYR
ncbi:hypothetical protein CPB85DRAFT_798891 [Mucidula mucida]|nr:hypothetical protein CPB85DRAFT_798891 [Mucidula mucida]